MSYPVDARHSAYRRSPFARPTNNSPAPLVDDNIDISLLDAEAKGILKVLMIEDNPSVLRSLAIFFELEGHTVRTAADGEAAFQRISEEIPDIIFCDLSLPGTMMGWDIAERIVREIPASNRPLLIALTGHIQDKYVQRSLDAGFDHHLSKPTSPAELRKCLQLAGG